MKTKLILTTMLLAMAALNSTLPAATTGRTQDTSLGGAEKVLSDSSGADTYITVATLRDAMVLTGGFTASGSTAWDLSGSTGAFKTSTGVNTFGGSSHVFAASLLPSSNDGAALGNGTYAFADLFLATGGTINIGNSNWLATHSSGVLTVGTGDLRVTTAGTNAASVVTVGGTQTLTNKTLTSPTVSGPVFSSTITGTYTLGGTPTISAAVVSGGLTATGSASNDFSGSTGTFKSSTGANTLGGAVTVSAATPSVTTASGQTNTGFVLINGKTSGGLKLTSADAAAYAVTLSLASQTTGTASLFVNDLANTNASVMVSTLTTNTPHAASSVWGSSNALSFEGATADAYETILVPVDPTADQTVSVPNFAANWAVMGSTLTTNVKDAANSIWGVSNGLNFEGATADAYETTVTVTDPTADRTVTYPDASGTVVLAQSSTTTALTSDNQAVTPGSNARLQLTSDNATATNRTFTLSATGAITGQVYVIVGPASNGCELADTGIQKLSATWTPGAADTLTLLFDGTNFIELARADN